MKTAFERFPSGPTLAAVLLLAALQPGCQITPSSSSWATDVYRIRLSSLNPSMSTAEVLRVMGVPAGRAGRDNAGGVTYDLTEGYTLTLHFGSSRERPQEVVLQTPFAEYAAGWKK
jgi:hypothetical protein